MKLSEKAPSRYKKRVGRLHTYGALPKVRSKSYDLDDLVQNPTLTS